MILCRESENCGAAEVKVFGGLGGRQRPWQLIGAPRRQTALMTVLGGARALWPRLAVNYLWRREGARNGVRTGGTESPRDLRAHLRAHRHTRMFSVMLQSQICPSAESNKLYFFQSLQRLYLILLIISALNLFILDDASTLSFSPGHIFLVFSLTNGSFCSSTGFPSQS